MKRRWASVFVISYITFNMTIQELVDVVKDIALEDLSLASFYVGNTWDMDTGKRDNYPNLWFEMPVLINYNVQAKLYKTFTFAIDILMMPELDDVYDEIDKISQCEVLADEFLYHFKRNTDFNLVNNPSGLSVKSINADNACGVRLDISVNTPRVCVT